MSNASTATASPPPDGRTVGRISRNCPWGTSSGYWGKFPDPFDPSFWAAIERRMNGERDKSAGDPFCIGYFVDNELGWGDEVSLAKAALASPPEQAAKLAFLKDLETKYQTVEKLRRPSTAT